MITNFIHNNSSAFLKAFLKFEITTPRRIAYFLGQLAEESGDFTVIEENLNYRPSALLSVDGMKGHFTAEQANQYGFIPGKQKANKVMIANIAYANRMGNGSVASGDGYKYRGRGYIQLTGKGNYAKFAKYSGLDVVNNPDLLLKPEYALLSAAWFWVHGSITNLNDPADKEDIYLITKRLNGGTKNNMDVRINKTKQFLKANITLEVLKKKVKKVFRVRFPIGSNYVRIGKQLFVRIKKI